MNKELKNPAVWFEIYVNNIDRATKFYETVFNIKLVETVDPLGVLTIRTFPDDGPNSIGASGSLTHMKGLKAGGSTTIVYFRSEDCAIEESRIEAAGGRIFKPKTKVGEQGYICLYYDTEENMMGIYSLK